MAIDEENKRINVDSAKKRAVIQHMDYDGFRQMVLGANLKPIKQGEASNIVNSHPTANSINFIATYNNITNVGYDEESVRMTLNMNLEEKLEAPKSQEDFDRYFSKKFKTSMQKYTYLRLVDLEHYRKTFVGDFDSELLLRILTVFQEQVFNNP